MITVSYRDLREANKVEDRVLAAKDLVPVKRWMVVQVMRQLAQLDKRPPNWLNEVEVSIDFDRAVRQSLRDHNLNYAGVRTFLQEVFCDWTVKFAEPVGRLPFIFQLKEQYRPSKAEAKLPTVNPDSIRIRVSVASQEQAIYAP
jgi:hypothetical protein